MAGGAAALLAGSTLQADAQPLAAPDDWLAKLHGDHRQYFDAVEAADGFPLYYAFTWANTMKATYNLTNEQVCAVIGFRHGGIAPCFNDAIWAKYKLGEFFKINDPKTGKPSTRNFYNSTAPGDVRFAGADLGTQLKNGAVAVACNVATTILSGMAAQAAGLSVKPEDAYKEWSAGLVPGVMLVPSGVLAVHRAQEVGKCTYCAAVI
jgi:hypothetical protein